MLLLEPKEKVNVLSPAKAAGSGLLADPCLVWGQALVSSCINF